MAAEELLFLRFTKPKAGIKFIGVLDFIGFSLAVVAMIVY